MGLVGNKCVKKSCKSSAKYCKMHCALFYMLELIQGCQMWILFVHVGFCLSSAKLYLILCDMKFNCMIRLCFWWLEIAIRHYRASSFCFILLGMCYVFLFRFVTVLKCLWSRMSSVNTIDWSGHPSQVLITKISFKGAPAKYVSAGMVILFAALFTAGKHIEAFLERR